MSIGVPAIVSKSGAVPAFCYYGRYMQRNLANQRWQQLHQHLLFISLNFFPCSTSHLGKYQQAQSQDWKHKANPQGHFCNTCNLLGTLFQYMGLVLCFFVTSIQHIQHRCSRTSWPMSYPMLKFGRPEVSLGT